MKLKIYYVGNPPYLTAGQRDELGFTADEAANSRRFGGQFAAAIVAPSKEQAIILFKDCGFGDWLRPPHLLESADSRSWKLLLDAACEVPSVFILPIAAPAQNRRIVRVRSRADHEMIGTMQDLIDRAETETEKADA